MTSIISANELEVSQRTLLARKYHVLGTLLICLMVSPLIAGPEEGEGAPLDRTHARDMTIAALKAARLPIAEHEKEIDILWSGSTTTTGAIALSLAACHEPTRQLLVSVPPSGSNTYSVPALLLDDAIDQFLRSNLALWLAQKLIQNQLLDEALAVLEVIHVEDIADPASYYIHSAVCAYHLSQVAKVMQSLEGLSGLPDVPKRYTVLAEQIKLALLKGDPGSLDSIARDMRDIRRRLDLGRADQRVKGLQDDVVKRLDTLIDDLERRKQVEQEQTSNAMKPTNPNQDDQAAALMGKGEVTPHRLTDRRSWGNLPPKERERALQEIGREMPGPYRGAVQQYFRRLAKTPGSVAP